jgi:hypothetical protein
MGVEAVADHGVAGGIKSKERAANHGEVFTPSWLVDAMLDLVKDESERIDWVCCTIR